jgi:hypothetical protein
LRSDPAERDITNWIDAAADIEGWH